MPTPPYSLTPIFKGTYDFTVTLQQTGLPTEIYEGDKTGMMQVIPALANRARFSDLEPIVIATLLGDVATTPATWEDIDLSAGIIVNQNNWFNGLIFQPTIPGYYKFNIKMTAEALDPESNVQIRLLTNSVTQIALNQFFNFFTATPLNVDAYLKQLVFLNGTTDFIQFQMQTDINASILSTAFNYLEITRI